MRYREWSEFHSRLLGRDTRGRVPRGSGGVSRETGSKGVTRE